MDWDWVAENARNLFTILTDKDYPVHRNIAVLGFTMAFHFAGVAMQRRPTVQRHRAPVQQQHRPPVQQQPVPRVHERPAVQELELEPSRPPRRLAAPYEDAVGGTEDDCPICFETLGSAVKLNACTHLFHRACIDPWLERHTTCPICRTSVQAQR